MSYKHSTDVEPPGFGAKAWAAVKNNFVPSMGNFAIQYNFSSLSAALLFMKYAPMKTLTPSRNETQWEDDAAYPEAKWEATVLQMIVFFGAFVGMLFMGFLGDVIGRRKALLLTLSLTVFGSIGTAVFPWGDSTAVYLVLAGCRMILGIGVGGIYPLTASISSEAHKVAGPDHPLGATQSSAALDQSAGGHHGVSREDTARVGWAFFWQAPGAAAPYLVGLILVTATNFDQRSYDKIQDGFDLTHDSNIQFCFRFLMGLGAVFAAVGLVAQLYKEESPEFLAHQAEHNLAVETKAKASSSMGGLDASLLEPVHKPRSPYSIIWNDRRILKRLIGTAGTWFFYDISYYGTNIYLPTLLKTIFPVESTLATMWHSLVIDAVGIPGSIMGILQLKWLGGRLLNFIGFCSNCVLFTALAVLYVATHGHENLKFALLCVLMCSLNYGPNIATYVVPTTAFPTKVRASCHGISAGFAKLGAVVGTLLFSSISASHPGDKGIIIILFIQVGASIIGAFIAWFFLKGCDAPASSSAELEDEGLLLQASH